MTNHRPPDAAANPLLQAWTLPHGLPPFGSVRPEHFAPAFEQALQEHRAELDAIAAQAAPPNFDNTVAAFDASGRCYRRTELLFNNLAASESTPALQQVERDWAPRLAAHESAVLRHAGLFARLELLHDRRQALGLAPEALRLLERVHLDFVLAGARLAPDAQARCAQIVERLATLYTRFGQNLLADEAEWLLPLAGEDDLAGLPDFVRDAASGAAAQRGRPGTHAITLSRSVAMPFLTFSTRRDLRERVWRAWAARGDGSLAAPDAAAARDNRGIAAEIMALRLEQARLHGFASYADYALQDRMAGTPAAVRELLDRVWDPAKARAADERAALEQIAAAQGGPSPLAPWDWRYYAEQLRQTRYALDDAETKPYFPLERMIDAMFDCAGRLFGLRFAERRDLPLYHPDVRLWEVSDAASGALVGLFIGDNHARPTKRGGAWMNAYRWQSRLGGADVTPVIVNNNNFAKPADGAPTLLSFDDVRTLFHEFGHGLHGLLSQVSHERLSGANVLRDFVELPSQLFEHWALEPEVLKRHARHVQTDQPIPDALIAKLKAARRFNQGYETVQYTGSALIDLALHSRSELDGLDLGAFEQAQRAQLGVPDEVGLMHRLQHFRHLFSSDGYAAGYYVYLWAEVLDADAFEAFVEAGDVFDAATAARLLRHIYGAGNSVEPRATYRAFRGRDASVEPMLKKRGLLPEPA